MQLSNELVVVGAVALVLIVLLVSLIPRSDKRPKSEPPLLDPLVQDFTDKQIKVTLQPQRFPVKVVRLPYAPPEEMHSANDEFTPHTILLNVVVTREDDPDLLLTTFDPPLQIELTYSQAVLQQARQMDRQYPQYGFWDGCKWVKFSAEKHQLQYEDDPHPTEQSAGKARVTLTQWNDPVIGRDP
jgi:hypothetical protein